MNPAEAPQPSGASGRRTTHFVLYGAAVCLLLVFAAVVTSLWFYAAAFASDDCHQGDTRDICTPEGQHFVMVLPVLAFASAVIAAAVPAIVVALMRWRAAWVWLGLPLTVAAYFVAPYLANWLRSTGRY